MSKENIVLIGFMGCGKTSVGKKLSYRMNRTFVDTDEYIECAKGKKISDIFASDGESAFRHMETECLKELISGADSEFKIFSTGGGMPVKTENRDLLKKLGTVFYLKVSAGVVYERLKGDTTRPLLQSQNPEEKIKELLGLREDAYRDAADVVIEADNKSVEEVVEEIVKYF